MQAKVVILFPTELEASEFRPMSRRFVVEICGVGMAEVAGATAAAIARHSPELIVLAGVAGAYPESELKVGDTMLVVRERVADLGALGIGEFKPLFIKEYLCPYAGKFDLPKAGANTINMGATPFADATHVDIENMEGAAFFAVCLAMGVPFLELRAVSNLVSTEQKGWNIPLAVNKLAKALTRLLRER